VLMSIYFWYPKMFGRMMSETLGRIHFVLTFTLMNLIFFPMHMLGMNGMPRRVHDYTQYDIYAKFLHLNQFMTICALMLGLSQMIVIYNFITSLFWGKKPRRILGMPTALNGWPPQLLRPTAISSRCPWCITAPMNT